MANYDEECCFNDMRDRCQGQSCACGCHVEQVRQSGPGCRFLGEYDQDRVLRCIRCGMLPMQHYPPDTATPQPAADPGED